MQGYWWDRVPWCNLQWSMQIWWKPQAVYISQLNYKNPFFVYGAPVEIFKYYKFSFYNFLNITNSPFIIFLNESTITNRNFSWISVLSSYRKSLNRDHIALIRLKGQPSLHNRPKKTCLWTKDQLWNVTDLSVSL
jgi:hypothetical protein